MSSIASLRTALTASLDAEANVLGENSTLTQEQKDNISRNAVDAPNETWNPNLPTRPA